MHTHTHAYTGTHTSHLAVIKKFRCIPHGAKLYLVNFVALPPSHTRTHTYTHVCCAAVVDALKKNSLVKFANYHIFIKQTKFPKLKRSLPALFPLPLPLPLFPSLYLSPSACCCQFQSASLCSAALPVPSVHLWQLHLRLQQSASTTRPRLTCFSSPAPPHLTSPLCTAGTSLPAVVNFIKNYFITLELLHTRDAQRATRRSATYLFVCGPPPSLSCAVITCALLLLFFKY